MTYKKSPSGIPLNPDNFVSDTTPTSYLQRLVAKNLAGNIAYQAYPETEQGVMPKDQADRIVQSALQSFRDTRKASTGMASVIRPIEPEDALTHSSTPSPRTTLNQIAQTLFHQDHPEAEAHYRRESEKVMSAIHAAEIDYLLEHQIPSRPCDTFSRHDTGDIVAVIGCSPGIAWDDAFIYQDSEGRLTPNTALKKSLRVIGLDIAATDIISAETPDTDPDTPMRPQPLISWPDLIGLIETNGMRAFNLIIHSRVPLIDLDQIDDAQAIRIEKGVIAAYDGMNGVISEIPLPNPVVLDLNEDAVSLYGAKDFAFSPSHCTAFVSSAYTGNLSPVWPYAVPLPCTPEMTHAARDLLKTQDNTHKTITLLHALAKACAQPEGFAISVDRNIEDEKVDETTSGDFILTTNTIDFETGLISSNPITPALAAWLDMLPKSTTFPSTGAGSTNRFKTVTLKEDAGKILANLILART